MRWKEWHPKRLQLIYSILTLAATPFALGMLLYCPANTYGGVDISYSQILDSSQMRDPTLIGECNSDCACTTAFYQPVCDGNVTYFSPCHAGCMDVELYDDKVTSYSNCTCTESRAAKPGNCGGTCTSTLWLSLAITTVNTAITFAGFAPHSVVYQRIVSETDRTTAQGLRQCLTRILGTLPSPIIFGYIFDSNCIVWRTNKNGDQGNCWIYDVDKFMTWFMVVQIIMRVMTVVFYFLCWWLFPENCVVPEEKNQMKLSKFVNENDSRNGGELEDSDSAKNSAIL